MTIFGIVLQYVLWRETRSNAFLTMIQKTAYHIHSFIADVPEALELDQCLAYQDKLYVFENPPNYGPVIFDTQHQSYSFQVAVDDENNIVSMNQSPYYFRINNNIYSHTCIFNMNTHKLKTISNDNIN